jgi:hypothetical protein
VHDYRVFVDETWATYVRKEVDRKPKKISQKPESWRFDTTNYKGGLKGVSLKITTTGREIMDAHSLNESIYGIDKKPRSMQQWEEISLSNTQKFAQMGCQVPMAWVSWSVFLIVKTRRLTRNFSGSRSRQEYPS